MCFTSKRSGYRRITKIEKGKMPFGYINFLSLEIKTAIECGMKKKRGNFNKG